MIDASSLILMNSHPEPIPFDRFRAEFLAMHEPPQSAPATLEKYRQITNLVEAMGIRSTDELTTGMVSAFIAARPPGQSPHTLWGLLCHLRTMCSYAEEKRYVAISPFRLKKLSKWVRVGAPAGRRHLDRGEVRTLLDFMERDVEQKEGWAKWRARRLYALTATTVYTAMRAREAQRMWAEDLDLEGGVINLVPRGVRLLKTDASANPIVAPRHSCPS